MALTSALYGSLPGHDGGGPITVTPADISRRTAYCLRPR